MRVSYFHVFLIRLTAVHLIQDMKPFTRLIYVPFFPKCTCCAAYNAIRWNVFIIGQFITDSQNLFAEAISIPVILFIPKMLDISATGNASKIGMNF